MYSNVLPVQSLNACHCKLEATASKVFITRSDQSIAMGQMQVLCQVSPSRPDPVTATASRTCSRVSEGVQKRK